MPDNVNIAFSREEFRAWLAANHATERECWLSVRQRENSRIATRGKPSSKQAEDPARPLPR